MSDMDKNNYFELIYAIVNCGMGSKLLHKAKDYGVLGGTVFLGRGTINDTLLNFLSINDQRREIVLMGTDSVTAEFALEKLNKEFKFHKQNHGIVFSIKTCGIYGSSELICGIKEDMRGDNEKMYKIITTIVSKGRAEDVIDAAKAAGSSGGTIINARGSGIHETSKVFNMDIEPEKEIVLILSEDAKTQEIVDSIREKLEIDKPGNGILFVQNVNKTYGIYEKN